MDKTRLHEDKFKRLIEASHQQIENGQFSLPPNSKIDDDGVFCVEQIDRLLIDIGNLKTHANMTELQLYEANEKNADLFEMVCTFILNEFKFKTTILTISFLFFCI